MKNYKKILCLCAAALLLTVNPAFSQSTDIEKLRDSVISFSDEMAKALPFNSTIGLNWSDAYIGQLLSIPPHFGIGITVGATTVKMSAIDGLLELFNADLPINWSIGFPLPAYTTEARIGGFILPFDVGIKFGYLGSVDLFNVDIDYMLFGGDLRYALVNSKVFPVKLSVGLGFNHLTGGISTTVSGNIPEFSFKDPVTEDMYTMNISKPKIGLLWQTNTLELKTQISFPLLIVTPYAGAGVSYAWSSAGYNVKTTTRFTKNDVETEIDPVIINLLKENGGLTDVSDKGIESIIEVDDWNVRVFGGISINIAVIRFDLTAMYNFTGGNFGASFGLRFQL